MNIHINFLYSKMNIYKWVATIKFYIIYIISSIINIFSIYVKRVKNIKKEDLSSIDIKDLDKKIEEIKSKYDEKEMIIRNYEHQMKLVEAYNKQYDYKIKMIEMKGKLLNDCLAVIKDIMKDVKTLEN